MKILEYLYDAWAVDRKAEWSIWMVHSKIDIPQRYLRNADDDSSHRNSLGKVTRKSTDEVIYYEFRILITSSYSLIPDIGDLLPECFI